MSKQDTTTKLAATEASLKRWQRRLGLALTKVHKLEKQRLRYQRLLNQPVVVKVKVPVEVPAPEVIATVAKAKDDIPAFLDRADPHVAERLTAARKKAEAEERKKMPLTGKAALAKIRERK